MQPIFPVLLAGGSGTRLWPLSRKSYPKQFSKFFGDNTLFQQTALRLKPSDRLKFEPHIILTNSDFRFIVGDQLQEVDLNAGSILIEPEAKNTAPAILAASLFVQSKDPEAVILVAPSDHIMTDTAAFHEAILSGLDHVQTGKMVTFGISPLHPETGYGYLELAEKDLIKSGVSVVSKFLEKPDRSRAIQMLEAGNYLWNAGIFLFKAKDMINAFSVFEPEILRLTLDAFETAEEDLSFLRLNPKPWAKLENISIDYAIMEKVTNLVAVPYSSKWSDLGEWNAVWSEAEKDQSGTAFSEGAHAIDCTNSLLRAESGSQKIVGLGLDGIVAIAMPDAVLVAHKDRAQDVKHAVDVLNKKNVMQANVFPRDHRPWGWFESLILGDSFQVKRICVKSGAALSLQSHQHRSEHWIVVTGTAKVTIDNQVKMVAEGESVYIPLGAVHRLANEGEQSLVLIEVQIGSYLGEDDIVRFEDLYRRNLE